MPEPSRRFAAALAAGLAFVAPLGSAQTVAPGEGAERAFGPLRVRVDVDRSRQRTRVTLTLAGELVGQTVLSPKRARYRFSVVNGTANAKGSLNATFADAADLSMLEGSFVVGSPSGPLHFTGTLETWLAAHPAAGAANAFNDVSEQDYNLTPELRTRTRIIGDAKNGAQVDIYVGTVLVASVVMTQASPVAVITHEVILGSARLASGASFTLTIPTPLQQGQVVLQASFQSQGGQLTPFAGAIATWAL